MVILFCNRVCVYLWSWRERIEDDENQIIINRKYSSRSKTKEVVHLSGNALAKQQNRTVGQQYSLTEHPSTMFWRARPQEDAGA